MSSPISRRELGALALASASAASGCLRSPSGPSRAAAPAADGAGAGAAAAAPVEPMRALEAWPAAAMMGLGINIGNTLENTTRWETGWGNPPITKQLVDAIAAAGFGTVRLPVAWDTYAVDGTIQPDKLSRVREVVGWITGAGMFCVLNIHWDGGWIDSSAKERFPETYATFSAEAERKFRDYWRQIAAFFAGAGDKLVFEALNEETKFDNEGSLEKAYATLTRVNQLFIDTVRASGGNNPQRLLIVTGYHTDFTKTSAPLYELPKDPTPRRLFLSVHYYTPWPFCGMTKDESWGKMAPTWGSAEDRAELERLFGMMGDYSARQDLSVFLGEFGASHEKESASRVRFLTAVFQASLAKKMVPVLWDTGHDFARRPPYGPSPDLQQVLASLKGAAGR